MPAKENEAVTNVPGQAAKATDKGSKSDNKSNDRDKRNDKGANGNGRDKLVDNRTVGGVDVEVNHDAPDDWKASGTPNREPDPKPSQGVPRIPTDAGDYSAAVPAPPPLIVKPMDARRKADLDNEKAKANEAGPDAGDDGDSGDNDKAATKDRDDDDDSDKGSKTTVGKLPTAAKK